MDRLFVYGSLAPGRENHRLLEEVPGSWEFATARGTLLDRGWGSGLGYPAIIPSEDGDVVDGFVFFSQHLPEHWGRLDAFEGDGYTRVPIEVKMRSGETVKAYVYALNQEE